MGGMIVYDKFVQMWCQLLASSAVIRGLFRWFSGKEFACQCRRHKRCGFDPWVREDPLEKEMALQYSCLENPLDRGAWQATVHGVIRVRHDLATKPPPPSVVLSTFTLLHKRL